MKLNPQFHDNKTGVAFIGHAGVGSRVEIKSEGRGVCIQETLGSQLWLILGLLAVITVPVYAYVFDRQRIHGGVFGYSVLGIMIAVGVPFFIKFTFRLLGRRRIYVDPMMQKIYFYTSGKTASQVVEFSKLASLKIQTTEFRSDGTSNDNFTVIAIDRDDTQIELCTTDKRLQADAILLTLSQITGVVSVT